MPLQSRFRCPTCRRPTLHERHVFSTGWGVFLTILTAGLFLPLWIVLAIVETFTVPWRCQQCGTARAPWGTILLLLIAVAVVATATALYMLGELPIELPR